MNPFDNPYSPGAGKRPPELAGRDDLIERASIALSRLKNRRSSRSLIFYGLRGVGKTVLLNKIKTDAEANGMHSVWIEAPEGRSLPAILVPALRATLLKISRSDAVKDKLVTAMNALKGFAKALKFKYEDIEVSFDHDEQTGIADSGDLEFDLAALLMTIGEAALENNTAVIIAIDELQYIPESQLAALITALHRVNQDQLPVTMIAAGLPQLLGQMGKAKSYAERLFEFCSIDKLDAHAAEIALAKPAKNEGASYSPEAIEEILLQTQGYPYFLQEWGKHAWDIAIGPEISVQDAKLATQSALAELDISFFRVRFDRLAPSEKRYMRAMAELGPGPHRSGDVAEQLGKKVSTIAPTRSSLIAKGMIFSPTYGDTAFTVPLFDDFMKRIMPTFSI